MNTTDIYRKAVAPPEDPFSEDAKKKEVDEQIRVAEQLFKEEWIKHPYTQKFLLRVQKIIEDEKQTIVDTSNLPELFNKMGRDIAIKVKTLQQLIKDYAS